MTAGAVDKDQKPKTLRHLRVEGEARELGGRVRAARLRRELKQEDLAALAGVSRSTVEKIEGGKVETSFLSYFLVLDALGFGDEVRLLAASAVAVERQRAPRTVKTNRKSKG